MEEVFADLPGAVSKSFGIDFNVPMECDCKVGPNWGEMVKWEEYRG
jgi:hypothetical protein